MPCDWAFVGCIIDVFCVGHVRLGKRVTGIGSKKKKGFRLKALVSGVPYNQNVAVKNK
jgi:hypothetical protein